MICITHCYSSSNSGDGLLVDLAFDRLRRLFPDERLVLIAIDGASFSYNSVDWGFRVAFGSDIERYFGLAAAGIRCGRGEVRSLLSGARLVVAVGGGYLRGGRLAEAMKSDLTHLAQLAATVRSGSPAIYLPQSIGPYGLVHHPLVRNLLGRVNLVCVRDGRSADGLSGLPNVLRVPDLAVLQIADTGVQPTNSSGVKESAGDNRLLVVRRLERPGNYYRLLDGLVSHGFSTAVQADGRGNDDRALSQTVGGRDEPPRLRDAIRSSPGAVVVSSRLHGSLAALMAGSPTVHLSYERKGWGAFEDLQIPDYVVSARRTRLDRVVALVESIEGDPAAYWSRLEQSFSYLRSQSRDLDRAILQASEGRTDTRC